MSTFFRNPIAIGTIVLLALILLFSTASIVPETKQVVILRLENPYRTVNRWQPNQPFGATGAGMIFRLPFLDRLIWIDKRVLDVELQDTQVLSTDQLRLSVDAFARFRVVDPLKAVVSTGSASDTEQRVIAQLSPLLGSALRNELGRRPFAALLSPERGQVMDNIQAGLQRQASQYGVQIVDVRIKRADLPSGSPLESALQRMRTARQQESATITARGQQQAQIIRAEADANAAKIYAEAFNKDPQFYDFYRAMQSYRYTFGSNNDGKPRGSTSLVLSPNNAYLREFQGRDR
ncbi:protease modulator HflC [Sphingomonas qilianensis]|uniref:Protein HflC n=1 Tax=Sphingomonas qilianensis TaxID=1736690 RepID=A0ABU9XUA8_9SPHN